MTIELDSIDNANSIGWADMRFARSAANRVVVGAAGPVLGTGGLLLQTADTLGWSDAIVTRLAAGSIGTASRFTVSVNGAVSAPPASLTGTWYSGGSATTTKPAFLLEPAGTTSTGWSTSGTGIGVNAANGFVGNLLDAQVAGVSKLSTNAGGGVTAASSGYFSVSSRFRLFSPYSDGIVCLSNAAGTGLIDRLLLGNSTSAPGIYPFAGGNTTVAFRNGANSVDANITAGNITASGTVGWSDVPLARDAANTLAQRNSTNAQAFRIYGTYTDASNYRRLGVSSTTAGVFSIAPSGAGTGASGNVLHISGLPTSNPGPGILWNNSGTPAIGT